MAKGLARGAAPQIAGAAAAHVHGRAAEDIGRSAYGIFKRGGELIGRSVGIAGEHLTGAQMAAALGAALGEAVVVLSERGRDALSRAA